MFSNILHTLSSFASHRQSLDELFARDRASVILVHLLEEVEHAQTLLFDVVLHDRHRVARVQLVVRAYCIRITNVKETRHAITVSRFVKNGTSVVGSRTDVDFAVDHSSVAQFEISVLVTDLARHFDAFLHNENRLKRTSTCLERTLKRTARSMTSENPRVVLTCMSSFQMAVFAFFCSDVNNVRHPEAVIGLSWS